MEYPADIRGNREREQEFEAGYYAGCRVVACLRLRDEYDYAALSTLPEGDGRASPNRGRKR